MSSKELTEAEVRTLLQELRSDLTLRDPNDVLLMDYRGEYLQSKLWKKIKRRILKRDNNTCVRCGGRGTAVHHRNYEREVLKGNADNLLVTVCPSCHEVIHFDESGEKRSFEECEAIFHERPNLNDFPEPKIDLRRDPLKDFPPQWSRMTESQRKNWLKRRGELRKQKRNARTAKNKGKKIVRT